MPSGPLPDDLGINKDLATGVRFLISQDGKVKAEVTSKEFIKNDQFRPPYMEMLKGIKVNFFDDSLRIESTLTARYARFYSQTQNILVKDSVVVINKDSTRLETEELIWNQQQQKFYSERPVKITGKNQITYGDGLEANADFTVFQIKRQRGIIPLEQGTLPTP